MTLTDTTTERKEMSKDEELSDEQRILNVIKALPKRDMMSINTIRDVTPELTDSKFGGTPYLPEDVQWPLSQEGKELGLLIQINCADLNGYSTLPSSGILQFFIDMNDDVYGCEFDMDKPSSGFAVLYHENIDYGITEEQVRERMEEKQVCEFGGPLDITEPVKISFSAKTQTMTTYDFRFEKTFTETYKKLYPDSDYDEDEARDIVSNLTEVCDYIGGYPIFTQDDPRSFNAAAGVQSCEVLLHLDSSQVMMWGDSGTANFFITAENLQKLNFSEVKYTWDCC